MNQFLIVFVGLFAIGNAAIVYRTLDSAVAPLEQFVAPAVVPSVVSTVIPTVIPETELADWEAYKVQSKYSIGNHTFLHEFM